MPFGVSDDAPTHTRRVLRGIVPGIREQDTILLWAGGIWDWLDPLTVIRAVAELARKRNDIKLYFLGLKHPLLGMAPAGVAQEAMALSESLGVLNKFVFFNHSWVDFGERQNYLLESDIGIVAAYDTLENRYSFRSRVQDYLWSALPYITTPSDFFAGLAAQERIGLVADFGSVADWASAITVLADKRQLHQEMRSNSRKVAQKFRWGTVLKPLVAACQDPRSTSPLSAFGAYKLSAHLAYLHTRHFFSRGPGRLSSPSQQRVTSGTAIS